MSTSVWLVLRGFAGPVIIREVVRAYDNPDAAEKDAIQLDAALPGEDVWSERMAVLSEPPEGP